MDSVTQYGLSNPGAFHIHPLPSSLASSKCKLRVVLGFTLYHSIREAKAGPFPETSRKIFFTLTGASWVPRSPWFHVHPGRIVAHRSWMTGCFDEQRPKTLICTPRASRISSAIIHRLHASADTNAKPSDFVRAEGWMLGQEQQC